MKQRNHDGLVVFAFFAFALLLVFLGVLYLASSNSK